MAFAAAWAPPSSGGAATTYFVRAGGDDGNDGLSPATALASVRPAARMLREPGDRLIVGPGTYHEGNIAPFGNGTPEAPLVLLGDGTGGATGDPPGPVLILPTNLPKATSGFLIRGRHDIVIEGFEIAGATDAAIEVRTRRRTGEESSRITLRNNRVRASRKGIQMTGVGEVAVINNHLSGPDAPGGWAGDGILLFGTPNGAMRPTVTGNVIDGCFIGITGSRLDGTIADNDISTRARNLQLRGNAQLTVTGNRFRGPFRSGQLDAVDLTVLDNTIEAAAVFGSNGELEVRRNILRNLEINGGPALGVVTDNTIGELYVAAGGQVEVARNQCEALKTKPLLAAVSVVDNRVQDRVKVRTSDSADVHNNEAGAMNVQSGDVTVRENRIARQLRVAGDTAEVIGNTAAALSVQRRVIADRPPPENVTFAIRENTVGGPLAGVGADTVRISDNSASGLLRAIASDTIEVVDNDAHGIACSARLPGAVVTVRGNRSLQSESSGVSVIGAAAATIENNVASDSTDSGITIRRTDRVVATGNELMNNARGGISLRVPPTADCNEDADVSISDLVTTMCVALQQRPLHDCDAADANRDRAVTVHEVILGVGAALGRPDPVFSTVELRDNRVENNGRFGINLFARAAVVATGNRVLRNAGVPLALHGLGPLSEATLSANVLGLGQAEGLFVEDVDTLRVRDNVVFGNGDAGVLLLATPGAAVVNNLIYDNAGAGIAVGIADPRPTTDVVLANNTIFGNAEWGIRIGSGDVASTGTVVRDSILHHNTLGGIIADRGALPGLSIGFNINTDGYGGGVPPGETDLDADPQFVSPAGPDGILGRDGFADDDFHVQPSSPAIDAGSATAASLGITGSVVAGQASDTGIVDLGHHYNAAQ